MASAKDHTEFQERKKLKQDVFVDGKFEDICALVEKTGPTLSEHLSVMFKRLDDSHDTCQEDTSNYLVMKDSEPYLKFAPQLFMY